MSLTASYRTRQHTKQSTPVNGFVAENEIRDLQFKLIHNLQSTLELQATLELFYHNIKEAVDFSGMIYRAQDTALCVEFGDSALHTANYHLKTGPLTLGSIMFSREQRFLEGELALLETLTSTLFYPLRNALLYREALQNSMRDPLTGIGNRKALDQAFDRETKLAQRHYMPLSMAIIDVDKFKLFNDTFGHHVGDKALQHVVQVIKATLRQTDQVFRFGGEEFVVLLHNTDKDSANLVAERIRMQCAMTAFHHQAQAHHITLSIGVSTLSADETAESLFERADQAMYQAKKSGRNQVVFGA